MHLEYIGRGGIFKIYPLLPFSRHPSCRFLNWSKNCVLVILFFFPDRELLMTAAGSIHNHLGWLGLWPLAESDNSELRDFYPPLNSKREPERERERRHCWSYQKEGEAHLRNEVQGRGWEETWSGRRGGGTEKGGRITLCSSPQRCWHYLGETSIEKRWSPWKEKEDGKKME